MDAAWLAAKLGQKRRVLKLKVSERHVHSEIRNQTSMGLQN
jgi:hypothetical protein